MTKGEELIKFARSKVGQFVYTNDWWSRMNPDLSGGTDCSGFVRYCYLQFGIDVGTWTGDESLAGVEIARGHYPDEIPWDKLKPGDLILMTANYYNNYRFNEYLCHIELYCGNGLMIGHPSGYGPTVKLAEPWMKAYKCITWMVRRVFDDDNEEEIEENMTCICWFKGTGYLLDGGVFMGLNVYEEYNVIKWLYRELHGEDIKEIQLDQNQFDRLCSVYTLKEV